MTILPHFLRAGGAGFLKRGSVFFLGVSSFLVPVFATAGDAPTPVSPSTATAEATAEEVIVDMFQTTDQGPGEKIGTITITETPKGLVFTPNLTGLHKGKHGFHVHEKGDCGVTEEAGKIVRAGAAGGHYDPDGTHTHGGPKGSGHKGDLPYLVPNKDKTTTKAVKTKRLTLEEIRGRSLVIHEGPDNYSDVPKKMGGGGDRMACGVVK